jgi:hypothetical protein
MRRTMAMLASRLVPVASNAYREYLPRRGGTGLFE